MPPKNKGITRRRALASGRPPQVKPPPSLSRKATRTLIRTHHNLEKQRAQALAAGDTDKAIQIAKQIEQQGGIKTYQQASLLGQAKERGGDSSKVLMEWLKSIELSSKVKGGIIAGNGRPLRMLEIGALSTSNACSRSGLFEIERIDLNSQVEGVTQQDFMERPLPKDTLERFEIISLSLVLNYVPDAPGRGEMLKRTLKFLRNPSLEEAQQNLGASFPGLFLVLPVSCVTNSRYLDDPRLEAIMQSLGYVKVHQKLSNKLAYYLWKATDLGPKKRTKSFKKVEVRAGKMRNNFAIVLN
jgi:25S rRNA (adenine2142-N1)-methyltransferase